MTSENEKAGDTLITHTREFPQRRTVMTDETKFVKTQINRRTALKISGSATAALAAGSLSAPRTAAAKDLPPGPATTPFVAELPAYAAKAPVSALSTVPYAEAGVGECGRYPHQAWTGFPPQKLYDLRVREEWHSFHPELPTQKVWGYDGMVPGPTFVARYGEPILVRIHNELSPNIVGYGSPEISTHLHNLHSPSESDGFAGDYYSATKFGPTLTAAGEYNDHHYPNYCAGGDAREALGTLWYHDHRHDYTAPNVYRGLAGFYLLFDTIDSGNENDPNPAALRLPSGVGTYDIPLVFNDKQFDSSGYLYFDQFETDGFLGNKFCVNGKVQPYLKVARRKYRFRLLDGGPSRFYEFYLTRSGVNQSVKHIANDGNLLPAPVVVRKVALGPAERGDIVIDFSQYPLGTKLYLVNRLIQTNGRGPEGPLVNVRAANGDLVNTGTQIMRFDVDREPDAPDNSRVPSVLRALPPINQAEVVRTRRFEFDRENNVWTVNGQIFDPETPMISVKRGTAEIWTLVAKGSWSHPVHIHFEEGRILSRNGVAPPVHERGRKDVYVLSPGEEVRVFLRFRDFTGKYMMHCHNTVHEDHAMMMRFDVVP
jgi:FtsP/CotA-like multicopper oxidase with cupredoxin domain